MEICIGVAGQGELAARTASEALYSRGRKMALTDKKDREPGTNGGPYSSTCRRNC